MNYLIIFEYSYIRNRRIHKTYTANNLKVKCSKLISIRSMSFMVDIHLTEVKVHKKKNLLTLKINNVYQMESNLIRKSTVLKELYE